MSPQGGDNLNEGGCLPSGGLLVGVPRKVILGGDIFAGGLHTLGGVRALGVSYVLWEKSML